MIDDDRISDDDLLLYHYRDGLGAGEIQRIERALCTDPILALRFHALRADLELLQPINPEQAPETARLCWLQALQREAQLEPMGAAPFKRFSFVSFVSFVLNPLFRAASWVTDRAASRSSPKWPWLGPALAALVFMSFGIGLGRWIDSRPGPQREPLLVDSAVPELSPVLRPADEPSDSPLTRGVGSHFAATSTVLNGLQAGDPARRQDLLAESIARNRMYAAAAEAQGDEGLARVLRAFDGALLALAADRTGNGSFAADRDQLEFELKVMQTKLASSASKPEQAL